MDENYITELANVNNFISVQALALKIHEIRIEMARTGYYEDDVLPPVADFPPAIEDNFNMVY
jgi:hypothetical protein